MLLKELEKIIRLVEKSGIAELEWEKNKERIRIKKPSSDAPAMVNYAATPATVMSAPTPKSTVATSALVEAPKTENPRAKEVLSPFVGTFYASAAPGAAKYVEVGHRVKKGDVLCIIEAMKIMNEIEAEWAGKVVNILVKDGQPVQYGQALFQVEP